VVIVTLWCVSALSFIYSGTFFEKCSHRIRHFIVCISAGLQTFSTQFLFCEILRFRGAAYKTTVLLDTKFTSIWEESATSISEPWW